MGKYPRQKQRRLGTKLRRVRIALKLSQNEMLGRLGLAHRYQRGIVSNYEKGEREPPLFVLLEYAHAAGICLDLLIDDKLYLPETIPGTPQHDPVKIAAAKPRGRSR
jgi:transcriptional regulator with XRE-family HTH domain